MYIDFALLVVIGILLVTRVALGRPIPLVALGAACGAWALVLVGQFGAQVVGSFMRILELIPMDYYTTSTSGELAAIVASGAWTLFGFAVLVVIMLTAVLAPLREAPPAPVALREAA